MAQLTQQGYKLKPYNVWFSEERALYLNIDPHWNLDPSTPDGLKIAHDSEIFAAYDELLMQAYNSKDPNKATGIELDFVSAITGTFRSPGTPSSVTLRFRGVPSAQVFKDAIVESSVDGSRWVTTQAFVLDASGVADVPAVHSGIGIMYAPANTLTRMITVMSGVTSVTNPEVATPGTDVENDASLRLKRRAAVGRPGSNQVSSLYGALYGVDGVRHVRIYENPTGSADVDPVFNPHGQPAHSITVLVDGGDDDEIAEAIYPKKNPGCFMAEAGTPVVVEVTDPDWPMNKQPIRFCRPEYVDVVIAVEIADPEGALPQDIESQIQEAFIEYASGELTPTEVGFRSQRFGIGENVLYSGMYTPVNKVIGPYNTPYVSSMTLNTATANLPIEFDQLSRWIATNITVTVTV